MCSPPQVALREVQFVFIVLELKEYYNEVCMTNSTTYYNCVVELKCSIIVAQGSTILHRINKPITL